jgi:2-polyprenyl-3-methyl-5-hydroxy-6-metoxy-1,4-benzoquinol methylase
MMTDARLFEDHAEPTRYWEGRARRFASQGEGLAAVCSFGMPAFYNNAIQATQRLALRPWLRAVRGGTALDAGCGVGRWARILAARGARVTGVDLSPTMIGQARRRAIVDGVSGNCRFRVGDLGTFTMGERFDFVIGVTVLQHILDEAGLQRAVENLAGHLAPHGRMVLLEAAPTRRERRCDSPIFKARDAETYVEAFTKAGLRLVQVTGVDPAPLKTWYLPYYRRLPAPLANAGLFIATALGLPFDALFGRRLARASWHKVFVLEHAQG